jgi:hypothetical protein
MITKYFKIEYKQHENDINKNDLITGLCLRNASKTMPDFCVLELKGHPFEVATLYGYEIPEIRKIIIFAKEHGYKDEKECA